MGALIWCAVGCLLGAASGWSESLVVQFVDQAATVGLTQPNVSGTDQSYIVEGMMGGAAFFDYDRDGDVDLYVTNGSSFAGFAAGEHPANQFYRNDGGRFADVTVVAGVGDTSWSMGCAAADYDNDGHTDLYVTNFGRNTLYRNLSTGRFADVTVAAGVGDMGWGTGASFGDYDRDGDVDLYVANYVDFSLGYESPIPCLWKNVKVYCGPVGLLPAADVFYRNNGDGTFSEWTKQAGLQGEKFYGMSALFGDYDDDGWPDLIVANDSTPNLLFRNLQDGRFAEEALMAGVAYSGEGVTQGCMGAAWGDYDNDGLFDLFVTNFADEYNALYRNEGGGFFADVSFVAGIGTAPAELVSWGTGFFDYDNDGDRDLFVANGHTYPQADLPRVNSSYEQINSLFENRDGRLVEVSAAAGPGFALRRVSRGTSFADYDGDGDTDLFILNLNGPPALLRNDGNHDNHYLLVRTVGTKSNRDGIGARVIISAGGQSQHAEVQSGGSYLSHNDLRLHFGLGQAERVDRLEVRWPSGAVQVLSDIAADQVLTVVEPRQ
ncbi:MAG: CRTAC1 family protein [Gemmatimonadota bacterium]|nr:CRTAC1 family protein [Gemmatimonadota bacterium]